MRTKTFDCVEMKRQGAKKVRDAIEGMTVEQEVEFWHQKTDELRKKQAERKAASELRKSA